MRDLRRRRSSTIRVLALGAVLASLHATLTAQSPTAAAPVLAIDCDKPLHAIPPTLYGIFFEEINHAGEGGLLAQLLRNPTFEEPATPTEPLPGWSASFLPADSGALAASAVEPHAAATPRHAALTLSQPGLATLTNGGHFGVAVRNGDEYEFECWLRSSGSWTTAGEVFVVDARGKVAWRGALPAPTATWQPVKARGKATATIPAGTLQLRYRGEGQLLVDTATMRPTATWKGHGLRLDLATMLLAMRPAFVRFPGGCYVEGGDKLADAFRWQRTLGPLHERPGHDNANWGYWSSDGLGYHEYLQLCEDLGALPMFVANCGMSHQEVVPMDQLQPWIDEALAAIEYANGDARTTWGARRAAAGHPLPFGLRYLEIGNENGMFGGFGGTHAQYAERYEAFRTAIAAKWPDVITIANVRVPHPMQVVDDHFYMSSGWFWSEADRYARADRNGPKVYVGEYAVTHDPGVTGNLRAALGEAAFLFGLQRHSDLVTMASYAPLFVHVQDRKWNPDAIQFDNLRACGTPSYWMQTMLAAARPDELLACTVPEFPSPPPRGSIGVGTWNTQAEYTDFVVERGGEVVWRSDAAALGAFRHESGEWSTADRALRQTAGGDMRWSWLPLPVLQDLGDCTVRCRAKKLGGAEGFLLMFHVAGAADWTWFNVGGWGNSQHALERSAGGSKFGLGQHAAGSIETVRWYDLRVECSGTTIRCYLDDALVLTAEDRSPPNFAAVAGRSARDRAIVLQVSNGSDEPRTATIALRGAGELQPIARGEVLTSGSLLDENTLEAPQRVVPRPIEVRDVGASFAHTFAPRSLTVLRLLPKE